MAKKKENTDNKEVLGENKENSAAKTADAGAENGVASAQEKFQIKLRELLALAKKKKNMLEYQEISDFFSDMQLDAEQFEKILDFLRQTTSTCFVLRMTTLTMRCFLTSMMRMRLRSRRLIFPFRTVSPLKIRCVCI